MRVFKKLAFSTENGLSAQVSATRSSSSDVSGDNGCTLALNTSCLIATQNGDEIQSGDVLYNSDTTPFDGGNLYWRVRVSVGSPSYVCLVNGTGDISVYSICV